jgi:hypothetical protein
MVLSDPSTLNVLAGWAAFPGLRSNVSTVSTLATQFSRGVSVGLGILKFRGERGQRPNKHAATDDK